MTAFVGVDTSKQVGDPDHPMVFANGYSVARDTWMKVNYLQIFRRTINGSRGCHAEAHLAAASNFFRRA